MGQGVIGIAKVQDRFDGRRGRWGAWVTPAARWAKSCIARDRGFATIKRAFRRRRGGGAGGLNQGRRIVSLGVLRGRGEGGMN